MSHIIPAPRLAAVETALLQAFDTTAMTDITLLAGGLSAAPVYKITVNNKLYVLKLNPPAEMAATSGTVATTNLASAAAAGIAPSLYYHNAASGVVISDFIENQPIRSVFSPNRLVAELAATIKSIHAIPSNADSTNMPETVDGMISRFRQTGILSGPVLDECFSHYETIKSKYPWNDTDKVFSHNDLNPSNILCDGKKIWIIDWDVASLNDRYIDLANAANFFIYTDEQEQAFLNAYFDHADGYNAARFYIMRQVCRIIYAMLMFELAARSKPADHIHNQEMEGITLKEFGALMGTGKLSLATYEGQFMFGKALVNEAVQKMRAPRFAASLALVS